MLEKVFQHKRLQAWDPGKGIVVREKESRVGLLSSGELDCIGCLESILRAELRGLGRNSWRYREGFQIIRV